MSRNDEILERALELLKKYDMPISKFCDRVGFSYAAFYAWRKGTLKLSDSTLDRIEAVIAQFGIAGLDRYDAERQCRGGISAEAADALRSCREWHDLFVSFLASLTATTHGKQQYFEQDGGKWYSRISGEYLTTDEMISEYLDEMSHYLD